MNKISLPDVTLVTVDCVNIDRAIATSEVCQRHIQFGSVKILSHLPSNEANVVGIDPIRSVPDYSLFMLNEIYKYIHTRYMLVFQADGFILNPFSWRDAFLDYDYIGAPWWYNDGDNVGNGGFSLRTQKLMEAIALDDHIIKAHPEDHCLCRTYGEYLKAKGYTFAPDHLARQFSVEQEKWNGQFGFHQTDISGWEIEKFTDPERHSQYRNMFYETFGIGSK
jgi:hypothetical protein